MAFNRARGSQIKLGSITNEHISSTTKIDETKLDINWGDRGDEILAKKLIVDYVQVDNETVGAGAHTISVNRISGSAATNDDEKGPVIQPGKNKVIIRNRENGDPIISADGTEVYGKLVHNGTDYSVDFYYGDASETEQSFIFTDATDIDFQFPQRFSFLDVAENFAANEKFVDGASDVSARLDSAQIVKDVFGTSYSLDQDGDANREKTIAQELADETSGEINTSLKAKHVIDEVFTARKGEANLNTRLSKGDAKITANETAIDGINTEISNARGDELTLVDRFDAIDQTIADEIQDRQDADQAILDDLASTDAGKGASLIGIEDVAGNITATTVEGAIAEIEGRLATVELTGGEEVKAARDSSVTGPHDSLDDRLEEGESRFEAVKTEVEDARLSTAKSADGGTTPKTFSSLDARLEEIEADAKADAKNLSDYETSNDARVQSLEDDVADHETRIVVLENKDHEHFAEDHYVLEGDGLIGNPQYTIQSGTFVPGNKSLTVYVNGMIQMAGVHYTEVTDGEGKGIAVSFSPEALMAEDVVQLRWYK